jgi:hypothetical protein
MRTRFLYLRLELTRGSSIEKHCSSVSVWSMELCLFYFILSLFPFPAAAPLHAVPSRRYSIAGRTCLSRDVAYWREKAGVFIHVVLLTLVVCVVMWFHHSDASRVFYWPHHKAPRSAMVHSSICQYQRVLTSGIQRRVTLCFACCLLHAGSLFGFIFNREDGGDMLLRKVGWL